MNEKIAIVILAAGESSRMGSPKQLLAIHNTTFIGHTYQVAANTVGECICIVLGAFADEIIAAEPGIKNKVVVNTNWKAGMGGSIKAGIAAVTKNFPEAEAILFITCDMPGVTPTILQQIIGQHRSTGKPIVASAYGDSAGIPALFAASVFPDLLAMQDDRGAKHVIEKNKSGVSEISFPGSLDDIDTPLQYKNRNV